uniref:Hemicentin-1 n=1 Tax=Falco tinnunculus TaxID=100819 RepID=A0A8C4U7D5_FALTI
MCPITFWGLYCPLFIVPVGTRSWDAVVLLLALCPRAAPEPGGEAVPEGASTLAFVFDVTGSMYDDLVQVIEGASKILETSLKRPKRPLYNFALVPFHDPEIGPVTITTDPKKFQFELRELYVQGGGDCPEMSIGAIKIALEISLPGSFIYVFTDARSKDYRLTHEVLQLIQQKQSQVVFVLTGDCDDRDHIGYKVYEEIASTSSGQVFHLDKKQVNEVLKWVEEAVQASKVHLLSTDHLTMAVNTWQIPFDPSLKEVTVSLSGPSPSIEIHDPLGKQISKGSGLNELLNIHNSAKVVNVKDPEPGTWTIKTSSSGRHSVRITGLSTIDFRAGFSRKPTLDFKKTSSRPVQGIPTFVLLNTTGIFLPARIDRLELLSITGELLKTLPVKYYPDRKPYGLWNISDFIPPDEAFFVKITGYDKDDYLFQRVSSVSFSSITPDAPKVTMPTKTPGYYLQPGSVPCHVESLIPFTQRFTKNGVKLGVDQFFKESSSMSWEIAKVSLSDEGFYECMATSSAGTGHAQTFLDVSEPPPMIQVPNNVTVVPGEGAILTCLTLSTVRYNLTWQRNGRDVRLKEPLRIRMMSNLSLEVKNVKLTDAGKYNCIASNEGGSTTASVFLTVQEPPRVVISPKNQTFTEGSEVSIRCSAMGYPKPTIVWTHNDMFIVGSSRYRLTQEGTLIIRKAIRKDAGIYGCLASNSAGTEKQTSILTYIEGPTLTIAQSEILVALGDTTVMECKTTGIPHPQVKWFKGDLELRASAFLIIDTHRGLLKIQETQDLDAGDYTCVATNDAGRASGKITLDVGSPPVFTQEPSDESADIGSNITLPCYVQGYPEPKVKWRRLNGASLFSRPFAVSSVGQLRTGALSINNLWVSDEGTYICEAENQFGRIQSQPATVTVTGLVTPLIGVSPPTANVIEGQQLTLPCVLLAGNPIPDRRWIKNSMLVPNPYINVRSDGSLHLERVRLQDGGDYTCMASNVAGTSNKTTTVNVYVLPVIQHGQQIFSTIEGIPVTLPCKASGVPKPSIVWSKKGEVILSSNVKFSAGSDGSLYVVSPGGEETGEYVCTATNAAGYATRKVQLTVYVKPRVSRPGHQQGNAYDKPIEMSVIAGKDVTLPCEVKSLPPPIITWAKEMQLISPFSPRHAFLPSGSMKISETQVSDSGMYICVATNIAGNVTQSVKLSVHVPPKIQRGPRVLKVQAGQRVDIPCSAQGIPPPSITWFKGSSAVPIDGGQFVHSMDGALGISNVQLPDAGIYKCVASNAAGSDAAEITVQVQESPTIEDLDPPYNSPFQERVANQRIAFPCPAKGIPKPVIKWLHNGRELTGREAGISILEDGTLLIIASVTPSDNGEYICVATNEAGSAERKYNLKVNVPPEIRDQEKVTNTSVVVDHPVSLFCEVSGNPFPIISWYKEDIQVVESSTLQILHNGKILKLLKAATDDAGQYSCKAINAAGSSEKLFNLDILVPPSIIGAETPGEIAVVLNQEISLECRAKGFPFPDIHWFKDGKPLFLGDPNVELLDKDQVLHIKNARRLDKGRYQCSATNTAGKQVKEVKLIIHVPPSIKGGNITTEVSALLNNLINLECETKGIPVPTITWYKDGRPLISSPQALYVDRGQFLQIPRAQVSDSAKYTCHVTNAAGAAEKTYDVDVYVPPVIEGDADTARNRQVVAGNSLTLECKAAGNPQPLLTWLKDGVPVKASDNLRILSGGKKLEILNTVEADRGQYLCVATSIAGEQEIKYEVEVLGVRGSIEKLEMRVDELEAELLLPVGYCFYIFKCICSNDSSFLFLVLLAVPPTIKSAGTSERAVVIHKPVTLQCIANGIPSPSITWLKDGQPVNTARGNIRSSGRILQVVKALLEDAGRYTCVATNAAGEAQQHVRLHVHEPPSLEDAGKMLNETVVVNNPIHLECRSSGNPLPATTWYKDNRPLTSAASATFLNRGQVLQIESAQISDTGVYKCVAVNTAGTAELLYSLQVHVPPSISGSSDMVTVVVNNLVRLECEARGIPAPILTWLKDGSPVSSYSDGLQVLSGGRVLALTSAQISDTGKYTCVAVNAAGESQRDTDLRVYVPPNIMGEEQNVSVLISQAVELLCQSNAIPPPVLTWLKDGRPLLKKPGLSISEDGSVLKIEGAQVQDTGRYTCEATNIAGKTEKNYNVNIWVSPNIYGSDDISQLTVTEGSLISLICESSGIPPPSLTWKKNGSPLVADLSGRVRILSGGRQLQISIAEKSDAASYTCIASNVAGSAKKEYSLQVYIRPTILNSGSHPSEVVVTQGNEISLECKVQGIPEPAITWMKDGRLLGSGRDVVILHDGRLLQLKNAQVSDTGRYVCVAASVAGLSDRKYDLNVHVPPSIAGYLQMPENVSIVEKNPISLVCEASGIPLPSITWLKNGWPVTLNNSVRILSGGRTLRLTHTSVADEGQYTCVVTNAAGEVRKDFDLSILVPPGIVGENKLEDVKVKEKHRVTLTCEVIGNPVPQITWIKDGQSLTEDEDHKVLSSGRFLQIINAQVTDTGRYTCLASNTAGDKSKSYSLNVLVSPTIVGADSHGNTEDVTVILNSPTSLVCEAYSYPPATITWLKDGNPLESNRNIRILPGGRTLQILKAEEDHAGRYTCIATNEAGETLKHYEVTVYIPPTINKGNISGMGLSPKEVKIKVNHSLTLECEVHAIPAAAISWYKDGQPLKPDDHLIIQASGRTLQIKEAQVSDTGRYTCLASNIAGEDEVEFDVNIQVPPSFQKPYKEWEAGNTVDTGRGGESKDVIVNNPLSLYCETNAVPPPVLTWYKDGYPLSSSDKVLILPGGRVLQIPRAQAEDAGRYMCVAVNEAGEDSIHYDVHVLLPPSISGADSDLPEEVTVLVNKVAAMDCVASGSPSPSIAWQKDGHLLAEDDKHTFLSNGRRLQVALNTINVFLSLVPPSVVGNNPENLTVVVNNFISLSCEVTGFPPPDLSWLKNGKPISSNTNTFIVPGARTLQIPRAKLPDDGEYTCIARNQAGESQKKSFLTVLVPPSIKDHSGTSLTMLNVRVGAPVTLECESNAIPPPVITWYKNRRIISESANVEILAEGQTLRIKGAETLMLTDWYLFHILSGGSKLQIARSQLLDSGTYTCIASNIEGKAQKTYVLSIQVPPNIVGSEMPSEVGVLLGESLQLVCNANGVPTPVMQWLKDGKPVASDDLQRMRQAKLNGSTLNIFRALSSDTGKYTCVATNPAGEEDRIFNLNVYVPPTIADNKDEPEDLTALLDTSLNIECTATGTPPPQINWLKNGLPLSVSSQIRLLSAGQILRLARVQIPDTGVYTCVASNRAGVDNKHFKLQIFVPPNLDNAGGTEDVTVVRGSSASMKCLTDGTPAPTMSWFKNGHPVSLGAHLMPSNQGMVLHFAKTEIGDTGKYTCVASNEAGDTSKHFSLKVLEPPHINGTDEPEELSVIVNNPLELLCISSGIPVPKISWMKDGRPLLQNDNVHVLREVLRIASAQVEDTGRYTCLASSPAGDDDKEYLVRVHVPPNIAGTGGPQDLTVLQNRQVILECKSDAVPPPTISWLKNGELLEGTPRVRILSSGRYLQINNADLSDTASYTCVASNIAGKMTREFMLTVHVAPTIRSGPQAVVVRINASAVLECVAEGVPTPRITWRKDGAIFTGNNTRYSMLEDGSLHIHSAHVTDTGRYVCMATSTAGTERKRIDLQVLVPPTIAPGHTNITVTVNVQTTLPCETTGIPRPAISWKKNGHLLSVDQNQNTYRLLSSGSLVIISPTVDDTAVYECSVSNDAGEDQRAVELTVQVPPSIADEATDLLVTKLSPVVISCTASGIPAPSVHWTKNGIKLLPRGDGYRILSSGAVEIPAAQLAHGGQYTCVARNAAGSAHRHATLHVQEPPVIHTQPGALDVIMNNPILLPCEATGTPRPVVTWQKEGINVLTTGNSYMVLPSGSLQIAKSSVEDAGTYTCVAQNPAGTALGKIKLKVQVPPVTKPHLKEYVVPVDQAVTLQCEAEGYPEPEISWHKDGQQITESIRRRILSTGALQVVFVQPGDAGRYTCIAANPAGSSTSSMELAVHIPPKIRRTDAQYTVTEDSQAVLSCVADGIPTPTINWKKDNTLLTEIGKYRAVPGGDLILDNVVPADAGSYTCIANNAAGEDTHTVMLIVHVLPAFTELPGDVALTKGEQLRLTCKATGIPVPKITWTFNNNIIPAQYDDVNGHSELVVERVSKDDSGTYVCTAENTVGSIKAIGFVYVKEPPVFKGDYHSSRIEPLGGNAMLNCEVRGDPPPTIQWSKKGVGIQISNRIRQLNNGSLAIYSTVNEDAGDYKCVATNDAGVVERSLTLTLQSPPVITVEPVETVVEAGATAMLNCQAEGEPPPTITWSRQGHPVVSNERVTALSNGSLRIVAAQKEDTAEYKCVARNLMGSVLVRVPLTVQVHGGFSDWLDWRACSVTCGQGVQERVRQCNNPLPANGGRKCEGPDTDVRSCHNKPCPGISVTNRYFSLDGNWSEWGLWEECSKSCGRGNRTRTRMCSNPPAQHGGKPCDGSAVDSVMCNIRPCPGKRRWSPWLPWGPCSETCGKGTQSRLRHCSNPPPAHDGSYCPGPDAQVQVCNKRRCPEGGGGCNFRQCGCSQRTRKGGLGFWDGTCTSRPPSGAVSGTWWQTWSRCSASCGGGEQTRIRLCSNPAPLNRGRPCPGDSSQISRCNTQACPGGPSHAKGSIIGNINDIEFGIAFLNATVTDSPDSETRVIQAKITNVPWSLGPAMRKLVSILSPVYWTTAKEIGEAMNGFTLTDAVFKRETQVEFATGEVLRMTHIARGLDSDGALLLDVVVSGHVLQLQSVADVNVKDYTEDYIQTGPGQLYAHSTRLFTVDGVSVPYTWNHTITYDYTKGKMPFLVETLHASSITTEYNPLEETVAFKIHASIAKGDRSNQCPAGFGLDSTGPYCSDEDECAMRHPCSHTCHNTMGSYYCSCPKGLTISADGRACQDIDECVLGGHSCHAGQDCENIIGSYRCVVRCGNGFRRTADGFSCQDVNECQESNSCHQHCFNTIGSFHCGCDPGYQLKGRKCMDVNECRQNVCRPDQLCKNTRGGYKCIDLCPNGMTKAENGTCIDVDECRDGTHQCRYNQICENTRGSYRCVCPRGYRSQGAGRPCVDINECEQVPKPCAFQCTNTPGSFKCICPPGQHLLGDGKSCAGLERLPNYGAYYNSYNYAQFSPVRDNYQPQQYYRHSSNIYSSFSEYRNSRIPFSRTRRNIRETCPEGYEARNGRCVDIDECETRDTCQHECRNTLGSYQCTCPSGYRLMPNGKTCQDIDECLEQSISCGSNQMCFNMRGSYQCIDTPCPPNYQREPLSGFCLKNCPANDLECDLSTYALEYKLLSLPFGIAAGQDLIRLVAYTHDQVMHPRTTFLMADEEPAIPFALRDENLKGVVFTTRPLREPKTYRMGVRALSYSVDGNIEYRTTFIVYIAVSAYPY